MSKYPIIYEIRYKSTERTSYSVEFWDTQESAEKYADLYNSTEFAAKNGKAKYYVQAKTIRSEKN